MTFNQFVSNNEQLEAHRRDFETWWSDVCLDVVKEFLKENNLHWNDEQFERYKESAWRENLHGKWLDAVLPDRLK